MSPMILILLENTFLQVAFVIFLGFVLARYKRFLLVFIFKKTLKFLPEDIQELLIEKNKLAYFLLILSTVCAFGFQVINIEAPWASLLIFPVKFIFSMGMLLLIWNFVNILEHVLNTHLKASDALITKNILPYSKKIFNTLIAVVVLLIFLQSIGFNVNSLLASLGIGGLALALAAKETLSNFFGGLSVILDKPFSVGDWIICEDIEGVVEDIGFRSTKIKTFYDSVITVPNSKLSDSMIDNLGKRTARRTRVTLDVTYDTAPQKIEAFVQGLQEVILSNSYTRKDYFQCYFSGFGTHSLQIFLNFFLRVSDWNDELLQKQNIFLEILRLAQELEIEFAFPTQTLDILKKPDETQAKKEFSVEELKKKAQAFGPKGSLSQPHGQGVYNKENKNL